MGVLLPLASPLPLMIHVIGGGLAGSEAAWQAAEAGRGCHDPRDAARAPDGRAPDRWPGGARLQQFLSRRQDRQRRWSHQGRDAAARIDRDAGGRHRACPRRRRPGGRSTRFSQTVTQAVQSHPRIRISREEVTRCSGEGMVARHHRHRTAHIRCVVAKHPADGRRATSGLLRCDQPDRAGRIDRHVEGVSRFTLGTQCLECQRRRWCLGCLECAMTRATI